MSMLDILKKLDKIESKKSLNESTLTECPPEMGMSAPSSGPASLNISAGNASEMAQILKALMSIDHGSSGPVIDMNPEAEGAMGGIAGAALGGAMGGIPGAIAGGAIGDKLSGNENEAEEWDNTPEEKYQDHKYMTKDLSGGINRQKKMYKPAAKGDNPMAVESIKDRLYRALNEKKAKPDFLDMDKDGNKKEPMKKAVADKKKKAPVKVDEGQKKSYVIFHGTHGESSVSASSTAEAKEKAMKKWKMSDTKGIHAYPADGSHSESINQSQKAVKEASKPDFLDMDKDGNKKEPMKKAIADKKKKQVGERYDDFDDFDDAWQNRPDTPSPKPAWMDKPNLNKGPGAKWKQGLDKTGNRYRDDGTQGGEYSDITKDPQFKDTGDTLGRSTRQASTLNKKIQMKYDLDNKYPSLKRKLAAKLPENQKKNSFKK